MTETTKSRTVLIVPCAECSLLNRVEIEFGVTPAKTIVDEEERKKLESEANNAEQTKVGEPESERIRPDDSPGKPAEGKPDNTTSDTTDKPGDSTGNKGADSGSTSGSGKSKGRDKKSKEGN